MTTLGCAVTRLSFASDTAHLQHAYARTRLPPTLSRETRGALAWLQERKEAVYVTDADAAELVAWADKFFGESLFTTSGEPDHFTMRPGRGVRWGFASEVAEGLDAAAAEAALDALDGKHPGSEPRLDPKIASGFERFPLRRAYFLAVARYELTRIALERMPRAAADWN